MATVVSKDCSWVATILGMLSAATSGQYGVCCLLLSGAEDHCHSSLLLPLVVAVYRLFLAVDEAFVSSVPLYCIIEYGELSVCGDCGGLPGSGVALSMASSIESEAPNWCICTPVSFEQEGVSERFQ